ncbi:uncharacterized protein LOC121059985 isoform X2 [Cygnus olor]|uniref:uncharacterized protein LOC121059985 isoform X2 n=1 Tax=Cygnus olor TaxID=8869 RepID=UPI001ADE0E48|nr:uncharacterized protein LOC121059985 isoform X2 [Cygnus olor]XP_040393206.1 uncharacterized protein LOC121059985 isoform X2 [Cygnus olor]
MGQAQGIATPCCRLLFLLSLSVLLLLVAPCPGETLTIPRLGLRPGSHVDSAYSASPLKTGSEPWGNPRALPAGHPSRQYHFLKHQGFSRDVATGAGSASLQWNPDSESWRGHLGAGGEKSAEVSDHKWGPERTAVVVLAILVCLFLLAALGYSVKRLLKTRQREPLLGEPYFPLWSKDPDNVEKERKMEEIAKEIESLPEGPRTLLRPPPNALHEN